MPQTGHEEGFREAEDGLSLYFQRWIPETTKAMLLFVHGLAEHSGRYQNPVHYFLPRGFACYAFDCRAHGRSQGTPVHVESFEEFLSDLDTLTSFMGKEHPGLPLFLVGHSQGGLVALDWALRHPRHLAGLVLSSPFLGFHPELRPGPLLHHMARLLSQVCPPLRVSSGVDPRRLSRDPAVVAAYVADPLVSHRVSVRWFTEVLAAQERVGRGASGLAQPTLVMVAGADRLVDSDATLRWVERASRHLVEFVRFEGLSHELFNEPEKEQVFQKMEEWLEGRLSGCPPPGAARRSD